MGRLAWYSRRLRTMSPAEICWRTVSAARVAAGTVARPPRDDELLDRSDWAAALAEFRAGAGRPVLLDRDRASAVAADDPASVGAVVAKADWIVAGKVQYFGYPEVQLEHPIEWHRDPLSGVRWPAVASARLDHRSAPGDAKWIWELNRLQHLTWLAEAWLFTGESQYAETAFDHLDSWLAQNPPGIGIAWRGAFEAGVRLVSVAVALQGLRDSELLTEDRYRAVLRMTAESMRRCWSDRSRFSSANNHLVGELAGLAVGALLHPELADSARTLRRALNGLTREADRQVLPDGAGAEQALAYQVFTGDLLLVVAAILRRGGRPVPPAIVAALRRGAHYLAALVGDRDPVPRYGDDDEGFALRLDIDPVPRVDRHLGAVAAVTGDVTAGNYGVGGLTAAWLGGPELPLGLGTVSRPRSQWFTDGGLVVLRAGSRRLTMDVGPLGYLAIAAHGHADALAVTLSVDGVELIGDPGAGSYYGHPDWRAVHRGTRAHATVTVDGTDQSVSGGPFLWTAKATTSVHGVDLVRGVVDAEHDGYRRLGSPVQHRRWLVAPPDEPTIIVVDRLTGVGRHEVMTSWPLHPDLELNLDPTDSLAHVVSRRSRTLLYLAHAATSDLRRTELRGDVEQGLGWWSDRLESRRPAWLLGAAVLADVPLVVVTALHLATSADPPTGLSVSLSGEQIDVTWSQGPRRRGLQIDPSAPATVRSTSETNPSWSQADDR